MSNRILPTHVIDPLIPLSDGHWVNERVAGLVEAIRDYHDRLEVYWNPDHKPGEAEFKIVEQTPDGKKHIVLTVASQADFNGDVLAKIIAGDNSRHDVLDWIDAQNEAALYLANKEARDKLALAKDVTEHVIRSPLNKYVVDKNTVIRDYGNRTR
jgi:hypothetical protein